MTSLADLLDHYRKFGNETAFVYHRGYRTSRWSYRQTLELAFRFARELENRNIGKGERVALWGTNSPEWVSAFFGCLLRGVVVVPMDRIAAPDFMQRVARDVQAKLIVCSSNLMQAVQNWPHLELETLPETLAHLPPTDYHATDIGPDDTAQIVFTSGTTAEPRGVVLTHRNLLASLGPIEREIPKYLKYERIFHPIRFLDLLPLSHVFGQFMAMFIPPLIGGTVIFQDSLNPREVLASIQRERVSVLVTMPRVMESLKQRLEQEFPREMIEFTAAEKQHFLLRWWRFRRIHRQLGWKFWAAISGGAALDTDTEEFWRRLGYVVIQGYGLTETSSLISLNHPFKVGKRSIGKVLPGREMKLDPETGEILVRGENVARQYWQGQELKPVTGEEGWFRTGDLGALDEEGNLYFKGRNKNVIVTPAGLKVYPEDLEQALRRQPEVRDCVVFGVARGGNAEPCAVLLLQDSASAETVVVHANESLADFQKIRCWFPWPDEDFPRTSTQKPKLDVIRQAAESHFAGTAAAGAPAGALQQLIQAIAGRQVSLNPKAHLESDLNLSSLDRVALMSAIEDRYQVDLHDREFSRLNTVADLEELVKKSPTKTERIEYPYSPWAQRWPVTWIRLLIYYLLVWPATMILAKPKIVGRERLQNKDVRGPLLVISNHILQSDVGFILAALPPRLRHRLAPAMLGEMLRDMRHPPKQWFFLRRWYEQLQYALVTALFNVFPLPQKAGYQESFNYAGRLADLGYSILIFPEGRRTQTGEMAEFRKGIGLLATRLNLPIVPMRIDGLFPLKQQKKHFAKPGTVQVRVGEPVRFESTDDAEEIAKALQRIVERL